MKESIEIGQSSMEKLQSKALNQNDLLTWIIYDHPLDFPDDYVVRPHSSKLACPLTVHFKRPQLEHVRGALRNLGLTCMQRSPSDDPWILEIWL